MNKIPGLSKTAKKIKDFPRCGNPVIRHFIEK